jgi:CBS domain-containing protein
LSPRAAWRLEQLGFTEVYDYVAGKADWLAAGLPTVGRGSGAYRAGAVARRGIAACGTEDTLADARERVADSDWTGCVVVNSARVVLGVLGAQDLAAAGELAAGSVMRIGPPTVRASEELAPLVERMSAREIDSILVTDPDGRLLGVMVRTDAEGVLARAGRL